MRTTEIILVSSLIALAGISLYKKYIKKGQNKTNEKPGVGLFSRKSITSPGDDDYEPYSKKQE